MSKEIVVLTPNGRRQKVQCTPNTSFLQVLEDVCAKQGFEPDGYDLKHYNQVLDLTSTIRWSNIPNKATLEMVEAEKSRRETNVTIALVLEDGERRTADFAPSTSLFDLLNSMAPNEFTALAHPTILYMRNEVTGASALKGKTLRNLGLIGGRAILRLLDKAEDATQANVSRVYQRPLPPKEEKLPYPEKALPKPTPQDHAIAGPSSQQPSNTHKDYTENIKPIDFQALIKKEKEKITAAKAEPAKPPVPEPTVNEDVPIEVDSNVTNTNSSTSVTSQENLERRLMIEEEVTFIGPQKAIVFTPQDSQEEWEDLPDDFYDLTVEEARRLFKDLQQSRLDLENMPLTIAAKKEEIAKQTSEQRLGQYKSVVVRVQFPDHIILQGVFSPENTIGDVYTFIKEYLETPDKPFTTFVTPLKETLDPNMTLLEAKFVPCVHMHFKWLEEESHPKYLKEAIYLKKTPSDAASILASKYRAPNRRKQSTSDPRPPGAGASSSKDSKVPKWFKK